MTKIQIQIQQAQSKTAIYIGKSHPNKTIPCQRLSIKTPTKLLPTIQTSSLFSSPHCLWFAVHVGLSSIAAQTGPNSATTPVKSIAHRGHTIFHYKENSLRAQNILLIFHQSHPRRLIVPNTSLSRKYFLNLQSNLALINQSQNSEQEPQKETSLVLLHEDVPEPRWARVLFGPSLLSNFRPSMICCAFGLRPMGMARMRVLRRALKTLLRLLPQLTPPRRNCPTRLPLRRQPAAASSCPSASTPP